MPRATRAQKVARGLFRGSSQPFLDLLAPAHLLVDLGQHQRGGRPFAFHFRGSLKLLEGLVGLVGGDVFLRQSLVRNGVLRLHVQKRR